MLLIAILIVIMAGAQDHSRKRKGYLTNERVASQIQSSRLGIHWQLISLDYTHSPASVSLGPLESARISVGPGPGGVII